MGVYDRKGSLQKGKDADIIVMDEDLKIRVVWAMGKLVPETDTLSKIYPNIMRMNFVFRIFVKF